MLVEDLKGPPLSYVFLLTLGSEITMKEWFKYFFELWICKPYNVNNDKDRIMALVEKHNIVIIPKLSNSDEYVWVKHPLTVGPNSGNTIYEAVAKSIIQLEHGKKMYEKD